MTDVELFVPRETHLAALAARIEVACAAEGLTLTMKATLAKHPGCVHWHYRRGRLRGTLEITLWPERRRLWFTVQDGRRGEWIAETVTRLRPLLERGNLLPGE